MNALSHLLALLHKVVNQVLEKQKPLSEFCDISQHPVKVNRSPGVPQPKVSWKALLFWKVSATQRHLEMTIPHVSESLWKFSSQGRLSSLFVKTIENVC